MKKLETSQIIENVLSNGVITEREVLLLYSLCGMEYYVNSEGIQIIG